MAGVYRKTDDLVSREIVGETIVVPIRGRLADMENIYAMNPAAAYIWTRLDGKSAAEEIVAGVTEEFEISPEEARTDTLWFLEELLAAGLIEVQADEG